VRCILAGGFEISEIRSPAAPPQPMRYTKIALLTFGAGLMLGLLVVVAEIDWPARLASGLMALGLAALPVGMLSDWWLAAKAAKRPAKGGGRTRAKRAAAAPRGNPRPRRASSPKR
jgi:hypothetical protein